MTGFIQSFGSKIQGFIQTFYKTVSRISNRWSMETLNNAGTKIFSWCTANIRTNKIWPKRKKKSHKKPGCCSLKKNSRLFIIFPDLISIFQTFSSSEKTVGQISRLFQEFKTLYEPWYDFTTRDTSWCPP